MTRPRAAAPAHVPRLDPGAVPIFRLADGRGDGRVLEVLDYHTAGEPFRIVTGGLPELEGDTVLARRRHVRDVHDDLRRLLMWEPRGHADMYGGILVPPDREDAATGVLFMHNEGRV